MVSLISIVLELNFLFFSFLTVLVLCQNKIQFSYISLSEIQYNIIPVNSLRDIVYKCIILSLGLLGIMGAVPPLPFQPYLS